MAVKSAYLSSNHPAIIFLLPSGITAWKNMYKSSIKSDTEWMSLSPGLAMNLNFNAKSKSSERSAEHIKI